MRGHGKHGLFLSADMRHFLKKFNMRKIYKITDIALIFTIIGVFSGQSLACASDIAHLRVPVGNYERLEKSLAGQDPESFPNPVKKIGRDSVGFFKRNEGELTEVKEARYLDEEGVMHECYAKKVSPEGRQGDEENFIIPQARILRYLNNRNIQGIPRVLDFVKVKYGWKVIFFEKFPPGMTLDKKTGIISREEAVDIMLKVTRIVKSLLDQGIYHWDIKLENIWVTDGGEVILFDFDFAFTGEDDFITRKLYFCGTADYMSERRKKMEGYKFKPIRGEIFFSHADEIFSLGRSLNFLLEPDKNQMLPVLQGLINKALAEGGAGEYKTIDEFLGDLEKVKASMSSPGILAERLVDTHHANSNI